MDFLDPQKQKMHKVRLLVGYALIAVALAIATTILLYEAYGFGIDKNGKVIQNGLVFLSTQPDAANIVLNDKMSKSQTNTRLQLPAGQYKVKLQRDGYRTWQREVTVVGGDLQHFDYPFLFPNQLTASSVKQYATAPNLISQSPDRHWAIIQNSGEMTAFELFDLTKPKTPLVAVNVPKSVITPGDGAQSWQEVEWSDDNRHLLLKHLYQKSGQPQSEYVMLDRTDGSQSVNVTKTLGGTPDLIQLRDKAYDQYWVYDASTSTLNTASLKAPTLVSYLDHVVSFKPYGSDKLLYVTDQAITPGKVAIKLRQGDETFALREVAPSSTYLIDMAQYAGDWYVVASSPSENKVYIYKNPVSEIQDKKSGFPSPIRLLKVTNPNYVAFSANTQYVMTEGGTGFGVYDVFNEHQYVYSVNAPLDAPQSHATWMDGAHIMYVSGGKRVVFDYDSTNQQMLDATLPQYKPMFDRDYKFAYSLTTQTQAATATKPATTVYQFSDIPMLTPQDQ